MNKKYLIIIFSIGLFIFGFVGLSYFPSHNNEQSYLNKLDSIPTKRELRGNFFEKRELLVVYAAKDTMLSKGYNEILEKLSQQKQTNSWRSVKISFKNTDEITEEDLKENVVFLVGTILENKVLQKLIKDTPFSFDNNGIQIGLRHFDIDNALLSVGFYPNPLNSKMPFSFLTGMDAHRVFDFFSKKVLENSNSFYRQSLDYELITNGKRLVMGDFNPEWKTEESTFFDFSKQNKVWLTQKEYSLIGHNIKLTSSDLKAVSNQIENELAKVKLFVNTDKNLPKMNIHLYKNMEEKGLMTGNTNQAHIDTVANEVHRIYNSIYANNHVGKENALVLQKGIGTSNTTIFYYGLPIYFTKDWQVKGYKYWSARLKESNNALSLSQLLDNDYMANESKLIRDCLGGALVDFLIQAEGKTVFLEQYKILNLTKSQIANLETKWQNYLVNLMIEHPKEKTSPKSLSYLKGFNFAHEGYSIYNGYGSTKATESLKKQYNLGSNAMAIVPYSSMTDVNTPSAFRFSESAGNENDEAVVHATFKAQEMGMYTLLKPQIWVSGSWPGDIEMLNKKDWKIFFEDYYRWIRHYAFLAEIYGIDGLCLGVEFTQATLLHPKEWRKIIKKTRGLFSGHLTYAANWGKEFEQLQFWDDLDYIGLNSYYPLSKKDNPTNEELVVKFDTIKTKIKKVYNTFKKPIVFTEIGFRSVDYPWKNPHEAADESINEIAQQRCYEVIFKGIQNEPWCMGVLWWKFPSYLEYRGEENNAFTPNNKLAEETVKKWFLKQQSQ